jgi:predicted negative regulator of RcsB-dependent stress response
VADASALLNEKHRTAYGVVGAAQIAVWFFEAQNFDDAYTALKNALDAHNAACRAYLENQKKENQSDVRHSNQSVA